MVDLRVQHETPREGGDGDHCEHDCLPEIEVQERPHEERVDEEHPPKDVRYQTSLAERSVRNDTVVVAVEVGAHIGEDLHS